MDAVASIMSPRVVAIRSDCDLTVAIDTFLRSALSHLVVVDPDRTVVGMLSAERALAGLGTTRRFVGDHAFAVVGRVRPDDDIRRAAEVMLDELVDAVPVSDRSGRVVGVVTWSDIVAHVAGRQLGSRP